MNSTSDQASELEPNVTQETVHEYAAHAPYTPITVAFDNSYARDLAGLYAKTQPAGSPAPQLLASIVSGTLADPFARAGLVADAEVRAWDIVLGPWAVQSASGS